LYDFDIAAMERYLKIPERQPAYRAGRSHAAFVTNAPLGRKSIEERMACVWEAEGVTT
jgi:lipoate-protein ligase A